VVGGGDDNPEASCLTTGESRIPPKCRDCGDGDRRAEAGDIGSLDQCVLLTRVRFGDKRLTKLRRCIP
jgi:hypothetical protein